MTDMKPLAAYKLEKIIALVKVLAGNYTTNDEFVKALFVLCNQNEMSNFLYQPEHDIIQRLARHALDALED